MVIYKCDKCGKECDGIDYKLYVNNSDKAECHWQLCDDCGYWFTNNVGKFLHYEKIGKMYK